MNKNGNETGNKTEIGNENKGKSETDNNIINMRLKAGVRTNEIRIRTGKKQELSTTNLMFRVI